MRARGILLKDAPGTMAWGHSGKCKSCVQPFRLGARPEQAVAEEPTPAAAPPADVEATEAVLVTDVRLLNTISGLDAYNARRNQRLRAKAAGAAAAHRVGLVA